MRLTNGNRKHCVNNIHTARATKAEEEWGRVSLVLWMIDAKQGPLRTTPNVAPGFNKAKADQCLVTSVENNSIDFDLIFWDF